MSFASPSSPVTLSVSGGTPAAGTPSALAFTAHAAPVHGHEHATALTLPIVALGARVHERGSCRGGMPDPSKGAGPSPPLSAWKILPAPSTVYPLRKKFPASVVHARVASEPRKPEIAPTARTRCTAVFFR